MGRKRTPTAVLKLAGSRAPRLADGQDDIALSGEIVAPEHLDDVARAEFDRIVTLMQAAGCLDAGDTAIVSLYALTFSRWKHAEEQVKQHGEVVLTPNGSQQVSPWLSIARNAARDLAKLASEIGLSPTSRSKMTQVTQGKRDEMGEFLEECRRERERSRQIAGGSK